MISITVNGEHHQFNGPLNCADLLSRLELAERVIADKLPVRFQVQMHKVIWSPEARGV